MGEGLFVGEQMKWQHTEKDAAFLMKFILKLLQAENCYTYIYLDFIVICPQNYFHFLQTEISKLLLINIFVRGTHGN